MTGTKLALVKSTGAGQLLPTWELSTGHDKTGPQIAGSQPLTSGQPDALDASSAALKKAEAALESRYAWIISGPDRELAIPKSPGSGCADVQGQRDLHTAISQLHKKHVEYITQAHQFITQKIPALTEEAQRQSLQECTLRRQVDDISLKRSNLEKRLHRANQLNSNLQKRLALLGMLNASRPRPLSLQEQALAEDIPMNEEKFHRWRGEVKSLTSRTRKATTAPPQAHIQTFSLPHSQIQRIKVDLETLSSTIANNMAHIEDAETVFGRATE